MQDAECPRDIQRSGGPDRRAERDVDNGVVSPRLRTDTPRQRSVPSPPAPALRDLAFGVGMGRAVRGSCLSRRQASSELWFAGGAAVLQNIVLSEPAVVATLRVGTGIGHGLIDGRPDGHGPTASARAVLTAVGRLPVPTHACC